MTTRTTTTRLATATFATFLSVAATAQPEAPPLHPGDGGMKTRFHEVLPFKALSTPRPLRLGEQVTCERDCTVPLADGDTMELEAGAIVRAAHPLFVRFDGQEMALRCPVVDLVAGTITVSHESPGIHPPLIVSRSYQPTVAVHRGKARVRALAQRTAIAPVDGSVEVRTARGWSPVAPQDAYTLARDGKLTARPAISTPTWLPAGPHQRPIGLAATSPRALVESSWSPMAGAQRYVVEIASSGSFDTIVERMTVDAPQSHFATTLPEGRYFARVTAVDVDGLSTESSAVRALRVVRTSLPTGGFLAGPDTIVVPDGSFLRLLDASDVELSVGQSGFHGVPTELGAPAGTDAPVLLRLAGRRSTATAVTIARRALQAHVELSPSLPVWPADRIEAVVRFADPSGRVDTAALNPDLTVSVGGTTIPASWRRDGATWRASIEGRSLRGPSLVQVMARDAHGKELGWGFVEVIAASETRLAAAR